MELKAARKALVHDWYYTRGGAEKVIQALNSIWAGFDHFALVDFLSEEDRQEVLNGAKVRTTFIQGLPFASKGHQRYLQLFPRAIESLDLSDYDLIISSSSSIAKGILTHQNQLHICYCHSPMRYAWDLHFQYLHDSGFKGLKLWYAKYVLHKVRQWDLLNSNRTDYFIANSRYIKNRIQKVYRRDSRVVYPPIDTLRFDLEVNKKDYYFAASRLVPYKKMDLIVKAFNLMKDKKLIVAGTGPQLKQLREMAGQNIDLRGFVKDDELRSLMREAKAFVFAAEEDFGIVPVEAQACGTPVVAYGKGGALETVIEGETGVFFDEQTDKSLVEAIDRFEMIHFDPARIKRNADRFAVDRFSDEMKIVVGQFWERFIAFKSSRHLTPKKLSSSEETSM